MTLILNQRKQHNNVKVSEHIYPKKSCLSKNLFQKPQKNTAVFERGLSDFHKLTFTALKRDYPKQKSKVMFYWEYKNLSNDLFRIELENELSR